ncbi:hypothetical protein GCM10023235_52330 [Kitasatospora terrestris]|uniref:Uncharacterized protein n=1 Tax=Kitasatospora terrestris TaxID=258051 RepID=A0ABP9E4V2_9ACTN
MPLPRAALRDGMSGIAVRPVARTTAGDFQGQLSALGRMPDPTGQQVHLHTTYDTPGSGPRPARRPALAADAGLARPGRRRRHRLTPRVRVTDTPRRSTESGESSRSGYCLLAAGRHAAFRSTGPHPPHPPTGIP